MIPNRSTSLLSHRCGLFVAIFLIAVPAHAHRVTSVSLISRLDTRERTYELEAAMEVVPSEDAALNDEISPEDAAREFAEDFLTVLFDEQEQEPKLGIEIVETSDEDTPEELRRQQVLTSLSGTIPETAKDFLLYLDPRSPMAVVMVVIKDEQPSRRMQVILSGEYSRPVSVAPVVEGDPFEPAPAAVAENDPPDERLEEPRRSLAFAAGWRVVFSGSALPVLVVVAMLLLTLGTKPVVAQTAVLLIGQSVVLALAAWRLVSVPDWVAPVFAALVAGVALEALFHRRLRAWRLPLMAVAGLALGGLLSTMPAFRTTFSGEGSGIGELILFLLGTELALLVVALAAAAVLLPLSRYEWHRKAVVTPLAVAVAGYALFSAIEVYL